MIQLAWLADCNRSAVTSPTQLLLLPPPPDVIAVSVTYTPQPSTPAHVSGPVARGTPQLSVIWVIALR